MAEEKKGFHYGWVVFIAACLIMLFPCCFTFNAASVFYPFVAAELTDGATAPVGLYITVVYLSMFVCLCVLQAGKWFNDKPTHIVLVACVAAIGAAFLLMSFAKAIFLFYVAGVLLGIGNSIILYLLIPVVCGRWFAKNVSTLIGIGMAMTGIGGMAWSPVATSIITSSSYHTAYLVYAIVTLVVGLPCAWLIKSYPSDKGLLPIGYDAEEAAKKAEAAKTVVVEGVTAKTALSKPAALVVLMLYCAFVNFGLTMNYYLPTYIKSLSLTGVDVAMVGATLASVVMFGSLIGKLLLGWTNDKSVPGSVIFGLLSGIIGLALVLWGVNISIFLVYVGGALFGVFFASATTTTPAIIRKAFGNLEYTKIYAWVTGICALFAAGGSTIWGLIFDKTGSFTATYLVDMSVMAVCFILAFGGLAMAKKLPRESKQQ
ncbi:MAG: MFS transporter [Eggerthellaceae bacterium]|nr:MFS transporter [Eggerthellaceae bacterium]